VSRQRNAGDVRDVRDGDYVRDGRKSSDQRRTLEDDGVSFPLQASEVQPVARVYISVVRVRGCLVIKGVVRRLVACPLRGCHGKCGF
jgi:hypothetical protein